MAALTLLRLLHPIVPWGELTTFFLIAVFCMWRLYRGGRISPVILIVGNGLSYAAAVLSVAGSGIS